MDQQHSSELPSIPQDVDPTEAVLRLLAMAEQFRVRRTPKYKLAIKCLFAAQKIPCPKELSARVELETGKCLYYYTKNTRLARLHLEHAYKKFKELDGQSEVEVARLQTICMIGEIYVEERKYEQIRNILKNEIETSKKYPTFYARIMFMYADLYMKLKDFDKTLEVVKQAVAYFSKANDIVIICYFVLIKCLIYSIQSSQCQTELGSSVAELGELLNQVPAQTPALEDIRAFCYSIQLSFFLSAGFFTNSKKCLQQLHITVQLASKKESDVKPHFRWLSSEMLTAVAYVFTVLTSIQFNNVDRAKRYFHTSIKHFEALRQNWSRSNWPPITERRFEEMADRLEILVYEAIAPTFLIIGHPDDCITHIQRMRELVTKNTYLIDDFGAQFHCLLGMYAAYFQEYDDAKTQYNIAVKLTSDHDLQLFSYLSLGLVFLCAGKTFEFYETIDKISMPHYARNLRALVLFVNAINTYLHDRVDDCKSYIGQSLNISQEAEMGRTQSLASLLLSTLTKSKNEEALKVGISWAEKLGDLSLRLWGCKQRFEYLKQANDQVALEANLNEESELKQMLAAGRNKAMQMPEHQLLKVTDLRAGLFSPN